jgi:hypothetical protein
VLRRHAHRVARGQRARRVQRNDQLRAGARGNGAQGLAAGLHAAITIHTTVSLLVSSRDAISESRRMLATRATSLSVTDPWDSKTADGSSTGLHGCHHKGVASACAIDHFRGSRRGDRRTYCAWEAAVPLRPFLHIRSARHLRLGTPAAMASRGSVRRAEGCSINRSHSASRGRYP